MANKKTEKTEQNDDIKVGAADLANALADALQAIKPKDKVTARTRIARTPWSPKDGSPRLKLRRKMYHHGTPLENRISNEEIELLNQIRPGTYCGGWIEVIRRKDKGLNIDYKVRTASQRLKLINDFGIRNFKELLERLIHEADNPTLYKIPDLD